MITVNYAALANAASSVIQAFGRADLILRAGTDDQTVTGAILDYMTREIDGKMIVQGDLRVLIDASSGVVPDPQTQRLIVDDKNYRIIACRPLAPGGVILYWDLQVRA